MTFKDRFRKRIKKARISRGMSQKDLAQKVGVTNTCISMYENGKRMPNLEIARSIADALDISIDAMIPHIVSDYKIAKSTIGMLHDMPRIYEDHDADCLFIDMLAAALVDEPSWGVAWCPIHNIPSGSYGDIIDAIIVLAEKAEAYDDMVGGD